MRLNNKTFLTIVISGILLMTSCVNDDDLPFLNDSTVSWESTLSDILEDNSQMLLSNKLELLDFSAIPYNFESEESFFNDDNAYIPVYYQGGTSFYISHIDSLSNDTTLQTNEKIAQIKSKVRNVLFSSKELDVVQLKWKKNNQLFSSIALFNSITGELEYDNVLINLPLVDVKVMTKGGGITPRIVSAEYEPYVKEDQAIVSYSIGVDVIAKAIARWEAYGEWHYFDYHVAEGGYYVRIYQYYHDRVDTYTSTWINPDYVDSGIYNAYSYCAELHPINGSSAGKNNYAVRFALYAGETIYAFSQLNYPGGDHYYPTEENIIMVDEIREYPYKEDQIFWSDYYSVINVQ